MQDSLLHLNYKCSIFFLSERVLTNFNTFFMFDFWGLKPKLKIFSSSEKIPIKKSQKFNFKFDSWTNIKSLY